MDEVPAEEPGIRRHIGFTGTPYNKNDYFPDVIYNYSIKDARDEKIIKRINPIIRIESDEEGIELTARQRYEQIILTHQENRETYAYPDRQGRRRGQTGDDLHLSHPEKRPGQRRGFHPGAGGIHA